MGQITDLIGARVTCMGLGNAYTWPLGYVIVQVQVDGVQSYAKDQIALVVLDELKFAEQIPIILGTPHNKLHHKCHEREGNRGLGDALWWMPGDTPIINV